MIISSNDNNTKLAKLLNITPKYAPSLYTKDGHEIDVSTIETQQGLPLYYSLLLICDQIEILPDFTLSENFIKLFKLISASKICNYLGYKHTSVSVHCVFRGLVVKHREHKDLFIEASTEEESLVLLAIELSEYLVNEKYVETLPCNMDWKY